MDKQRNMYHFIEVKYKRCLNKIQRGGDFLSSDLLGDVLTSMKLLATPCGYSLHITQIQVAMMRVNLFHCRTSF